MAFGNDEVTLFLGSTSGLGTRSCTCGLGAGLTVIRSVCVCVCVCVCVFQVCKFRSWIDVPQATGWFTSMLND